MWALQALVMVVTVTAEEVEGRMAKSWTGTSGGERGGTMGPMVPPLGEERSSCGASCTCQDQYVNCSRCRVDWLATPGRLGLITPGQVGPAGGAQRPGRGGDQAGAGGQPDQGGGQHGDVQQVGDGQHAPFPCVSCVVCAISLDDSLPGDR